MDVFDAITSQFDAAANSEIPEDNKYSRILI